MTVERLRETTYVSPISRGNRGEYAREMSVLRHQDRTPRFNRQTTACPRCSHTFTHSQHPYRASDFARGGSGKISLSISLLALVASTALYLQWHVPGKVAGLAKYDLTTPETSLRTYMVVNAGDDVLAQAAIAYAADRTPYREYLRTLAIKKTIQMDGNTAIILYSREEQG